MNIFTLLDMAAEAFEDRHAVTDGATTLGFADLRAAARGAARLLHPEEARIAFLDVAGPAASVALFGAAAAGRAYVPLNWRLTREEVAACGPCPAGGGARLFGRHGAAARYPADAHPGFPRCGT